MERSQKKQIVESLNQIFNDSQSVIVVQFKGLTVDHTTKLRRQMRSHGAEFKVTKNRLAKIAVKGTEYEDLISSVNGPTAIAFSKDPISAAKGVVQFANENDKLVIIGGMADNQILSVNDVKALAQLPSLDELRAKIIGVISAPATKIAGVLQAPAAQLARVISAYAKKEGN